MNSYLHGWIKDLHSIDEANICHFGSGVLILRFDEVKPSPDITAYLFGTLPCSFYKTLVQCLLHKAGFSVFSRAIRSIFVTNEFILHMFLCKHWLQQDSPSVIAKM